jgi:hypothetical protein
MRRREYWGRVAAAGVLAQSASRPVHAARAAAPLKLGVASYSLRKFSFEQ